MDEVPGGVGCVEDVGSGARRCWGLRWHGGAGDGGGARGACHRLVARARGSRGGVGRANFVRPVALAPSRSRVLWNREHGPFSRPWQAPSRVRSVLKLGGAHLFF